MNPGPVMIAAKTVRPAQAVPAPSMRDSILGWFRPIVVGYVQTNIQDEGNNKPVTRELKTSGVLQPIDEKLVRQFSGARSWGHWWLHCLPNLTVNTNDVIRIDGKWYSVMEKADYTAYGYVRYMLIETAQSYDTSP